MGDKTEKSDDQKKSDREEQLVERALPSADRSFLPTLVEVAADVATRSVENSFGALRDVHGELFVRVAGAVDLIDDVQQGTVSIVHRLAARVDQVSLAFIDGGATVASSALRAGKPASESAAELAGKAAGAVGREASRRAA